MRPRQRQLDSSAHPWQSLAGHGHSHGHGQAKETRAVVMLPALRAAVRPTPTWHAKSASFS